MMYFWKFNPKMLTFYMTAVTPTFGFSIELNTLQMKGPSYVIIFYYNSHS